MPGVKVLYTQRCDPKKNIIAQSFQSSGDSTQLLIIIEVSTLSHINTTVQNFSVTTFLSHCRMKVNLLTQWNNLNVLELYRYKKIESTIFKHCIHSSF